MIHLSFSKKSKNVNGKRDFDTKMRRDFDDLVLENIDLVKTSKKRGIFESIDHSRNQDLSWKRANLGKRKCEQLLSTAGTGKKTPCRQKRRRFDDSTSGKKPVAIAKEPLGFLKFRRKRRAKPEWFSTPEVQSKFGKARYGPQSPRVKIDINEEDHQKTNVDRGLVEVGGRLQNAQTPINKIRNNSGYKAICRMFQ